MENKGTFRENSPKTNDYQATVETTHVDHWEKIKRISWGAIFAGVLVAIVTQLALTLLGIGIGLSTVDATEEANPVRGLGTGSAIWYMVSSLIALFAGGWVAGRTARAPRTTDSVIHGLVMWSLVTVFSFYLLTTTIGSIVGGVGRFVGGTLSTVGRAGMMGVAAGTMNNNQQPGQNQEQGIDFNNLKGEISQLLSQTGKPGLQPDALGNRADNAVDRIIANPQSADDVIQQFFGKGGVGEQVDREAVVNMIVSRTGKSREEANQIADNWMNTYQQAQQKWQQTKVQAEQKAREVADDTAKAVSTASILAFVGLVLGAATSGFAAKKGNDSADLVLAQQTSTHLR